MTEHQPQFKPWQHRFAVLAAFCTLALICLGGLVTSHGAGMAVPDWPTSYGYNMFALPFHYWKGGVFWEHSHRLAGSVVGLLTLLLAVWLWFGDKRRWMRWLGVIALVAVIVQGVLGGLRVVMFKDEIGVFHATLAQLFFALMCALALFTSRWWMETGVQPSTLNSQQPTSAAAKFFLATSVLIFLQLVIAAMMRHQHAGLAIPDFPLAYGKVWPDMSAEAVERYNQHRLEVVAHNPITAFQIALQMTHRIVALIIVLGVALAFAKSRGTGPLRKLSALWLGLILVQVALGAWTIWSNKAADVATAHVLVGALSLVTGVCGCLICFRRPSGRPVPAPNKSSSLTGTRTAVS